MAREIEYIDPDKLVIIGLDTDDTDDHPLFDERVFLPVNEALVKNIMVYGIQQPVIVQKSYGNVCVVDGRQRVRAAREAKQRQAEAGEYEVKVPTREAKGTDDRVMGIMVSTNEQRQDDEVLTKATKAARLLDITGDMDEVCIAFGRTKSTIQKWLLLTQADTRVHDAIRQGKISSSAAVDIARYPREEQVEVLEKLLRQTAGEKISAADVQAQAAEDGVIASDPSKAQATVNPTATLLGDDDDGDEQEEARPKRASTSNRGQNQRGIKRTWLRRALKTDAAEDLEEEQKAVLLWFSTGESEPGTWYDDFRWAAEKEME